MISPKLKKTIFTLIFSLLLALMPYLKINAWTKEELARILSGRILLQVENNGEAWYVNPANKKRYFLNRPDDAFLVMKKLGLGISNENLNKIKIGILELDNQTKDTDKDGLSDELEKILKTDPHNPDTDQDGYSDKEEILNNYNPISKEKNLFINTNDLLSKKLSGKILLQVENNGEAWYLNPQDQKRYFLGRPDDAFLIMKKLGLGISNEDIRNIEIEGNYVQEYLTNIDPLVLNMQNLDIIFKNQDELIGELKRGNELIEKKYRKEKDNKEYYYYVCGDKNYAKCKNDAYLYCYDGEATCYVFAQKPEEEINTQIITENIYSLINEFRAEKNLEPLIINKDLQNNAYLHSLDMQEKNYFNSQENDCGLTCRFNKNYDLESLFTEGIISTPIYEEFYKIENTMEAYIYGKSYVLVKKYYDNQSFSQEVLTQFKNNEAGNSLLLVKKDKFNSFGLGISISSSGKVYISLDLANTLKKEDKKELEEISKSLVEENDTKEEKISKIYEWITKNIDYDFDAIKNKEENIISYSIRGAYENKKAVCQGYAELLRAMLNFVDIKSEIISGNAVSKDKYEKHAWNKIIIDEKELYLDSTWDAGYIEDEKFVSKPEKKYFLIPHKCIRVNHALENEKQFNKEEREGYIKDNLDYFQENCPQFITNDLKNL